MSFWYLYFLPQLDILKLQKFATNRHQIDHNRKSIWIFLSGWVHSKQDWLRPVQDCCIDWFGNLHVWHCKKIMVTTIFLVIMVSMVSMVFIVIIVIMVILVIFLFWLFFCYFVFLVIIAIMVVIAIMCILVIMVLWIKEWRWKLLKFLN
jgi:hypothetical protein